MGIEQKKNEITPDDDDDDDIFELTKPKKSKPTEVVLSESSGDELDGMIHDSQLKKKKFFN